MKLQSLSIFSLLLLLTACSVRENDLWLQKAEQFYADKQIDSTLTYLNRIIPEKLEGEDVYTYWRIQFSTSPQPFIRHSAEKIENKAYYFTALLREFGEVDSMICHDPVLKKMGLKKLERLHEAKTSQERVEAMKFSAEEITEAAMPTHKQAIQMVLDALVS